MQHWRDTDGVVHVAGTFRQRTVWTESGVLIAKFAGPRHSVDMDESCPLFIRDERHPTCLRCIADSDIFLYELKGEAVVNPLVLMTFKFQVE